MFGKDLPTHLYLWQCRDCLRVIDLPLSQQQAGPEVGRHLRPDDQPGPSSRSPWCMGGWKRVTYRKLARGEG